MGFFFVKLIVLFLFEYILTSTAVLSPELATTLNSEIANQGVDIITTEATALSDILLYNQGKDNEDIHLNGTQLIQKYGFSVEEHCVQTADGYILKNLRIPNDNGTVVLLMHGAESSSDDWLTAGPDSALSYYLASEGYDVWLANHRGNKYSKEHISLSVNSTQFWDYDLETVSHYDVPAIIDYALKVTGKKSLSYVGFSGGNTLFYIMCSDLPEYNKKIDLTISLSTATWMSNIKSPVFKGLAALNPLEEQIFKFFGVKELLSDNELTKFFVQLLCGPSKFSQIVCSNTLFITYGFDSGHLNVTNLPVIFSHAPAGFGTKQFIHLLQQMKTPGFRRYDYGPMKNLELYGSLLPPNYPVEKITAPVAILYGDKDWVSDIKDIQILKRKLKNVVEYTLIKDYNHVDNLWAKDVKEKLYSKIVALLKKYVQ